MNKLIVLFCFVGASSIYGLVDASLPDHPACGVHTGDRTSATTEFPWTAHIVYSKPGNKKGTHCLGTLINERYVLTSGHCVSKIPRTWTISHVKLGGINSIDDVAVVQTILNDNYLASSMDNMNDIALLKLKNDVEFTDKIQPICLPVDNRDRNVDLSSKLLEASEFGAAKIANRVELHEVSKDSCNAYYVPQKINIANSQICAGAKPRDSCKGNGGGALMKYGTSASSNTPHYMLVGVSSFGPKECGTMNAPDVYTRVSEFMDWIVNNVN